MYVFKILSLFGDEDGVTFEDGSQTPENNCEGANKKRKSSDEFPDTSNAPITEGETLPNEDDISCKIVKNMKELEDLIKSDTSPSDRSTKFTYPQVVSPKQIVQSEGQNISPNQSIQQVEVPKQSQNKRQNTLPNQSIQQVEVREQSQLLGQANLQNQSVQKVAGAIQSKLLPQANLGNQSVQQVVGPIEAKFLRQASLRKQLQLQVLLQADLQNQSSQQVVVPKQIVQPVRQDTIANQSIINEVAKVEKREAQSYEILSWEPRAFLYHNFLSKEECEHMIKLAKPNLQRSLLRDRQTGKNMVSSDRTSFGASLRRGHDEIIKNVEKRIAEATFIPIEHGEHLHVLRYEVGQKIVPHHDYFNDTKFDNTEAGQRVATFLMYLSPAEQGGETIFPLAKENITSVSQQIKKGVVVKPKIGDAVLFWSVKPDGTLDPSSLHGGVPVIKGNKWCCTKFMRAKEYKF